MKTFEEWKASLQVKLDKLRAMRGQRGYDRARLSIILTFHKAVDIYHALVVSCSFSYCILPVFMYNGHRFNNSSFFV